MSKVVRKIWYLQKIIWDNKNSYAHALNSTTHYQEEDAMTMTAEIRWELAVFQNGLPEAYSGLFTGKLKCLLEDNGITKTQWIISVWNIRYQVMITAGLGDWERSQISETFIQRHHNRRKRKLEE